MADKRIVESLINSRKAVKRKFEELRDNIVHHEDYLEKKFKPIADPIKELIKNIKHDKVGVKSEPTFTFSTPKKEKPTFNQLDTIIHTSRAVSQIPRLSNIKPRRLSLLGSYGRRVDDDDDDSDITGIQPDQMKKEMEESDAFQKHLSSFGGLAKIYMGGSFSDTKGSYDTTYGPKVDIRKTAEGASYSTGKYLLGNSEISFSDDGKLIYITTPNNIKFPHKGTVALYELIFKSSPTEATVRQDPQAVKDYKEILEKTNVHRPQFKPDKPIKNNVGKKYMNFIKPILANTFKITAIRESPEKSQGRLRANTLPSTSRIGKGVLKLNNRKVQYVPYKTPNTLVNRLRLLIGAQQAGNNSHDNEITYIIDELKSIKVIK